MRWCGGHLHPSSGACNVSGVKKCSSIMLLKVSSCPLSFYERISVMGGRFVADEFFFFFSLLPLK
jgi:hypothetical protein